MTTRIPDLDALIFYAIDKASPYALALHPQDDSLEKIYDLKLAQLAITPHGESIMWLWINSRSHQYGAAQVSASQASAAKTVADVVKTVYATIPR